MLTTTKEFSQWSEAFPNATTVVTLVDRLVHHSEIVTIEGESYRFKEAQERQTQRRRRSSKPKGATAPA